jgi:flagellin-like protein
MKANNAFRTEEEAVSPVIGVILMVAITVVLAAVVFVLVSDLGNTDEAAAAVSFSKDEGTDRIEVISAASSADWNRLSIRITSGTTSDATGAIVVGTAVPYQNDVAVVGSDELCQAVANACAGSNVAIGNAIDVIDAGDFLEVCATDGIGGVAGGEATNVVVVITDTTANAKVYEATFSTIASC